MDKQVTRDFIKRARALAKRKKWAIRTISRKLFNQNPYGLERLEESLKQGVGGPPHINVLDAMARLDQMEADEEKEDEVVAA